MTYVVIEKFGCTDSDGDGFYDDGDDLPNDARDYIDSDGDEIGFSMDYNDSNRLVQTLEDHCAMVVTDETEKCQGVRDVDYQNYLADKEASGENALNYYAWRNSADAKDEEAKSSDQYLDTAKEILPFLGAGFAAIVAVLLIYAGIGKARRRRALVKTYGAPFADGENSAEDEALEGKAGLSASGGVESDKYWDDEIEPMEVGDDGNELGSGFDDIDIKGDGETTESSGVLEESAYLKNWLDYLHKPVRKRSTRRSPNLHQCSKHHLRRHLCLQKVYLKAGQWISGNGMVLNGLLSKVSD